LKALLPNRQFNKPTSLASAGKRVDGESTSVDEVEKVDLLFLAWKNTLELPESCLLSSGGGVERSKSVIEDWDPWLNSLGGGLEIVEWRACLPLVRSMGWTCGEGWHGRPP
jgi:hypothetical protein